MKKLVITGCGIKSLSQITRENQAAIEQAEYVLYLVNEPIMEQWIQNKAKKFESLYRLYFSEEHRNNAYKQIVNRILWFIKYYDHICVVVYGHPLLLSNSIDKLVALIDKEKISLTILPAISAFDCLLTDLKIDPFYGCVSVEANVLIKENKYIDSTYHLIIWQIGLINDKETVSNANRSAGLTIIKNKLLSTYDDNQECILYEASIYPHIPPKIIKTKLSNLECEEISRLTTLYVPPKIIC